MTINTILITGDNTEKSDLLKQIVFKENEQGTREINQMPEPDLQNLINNKKKKAILIGVIGHIGHASVKILETLNSHSEFHGKVVVVSEENKIPSRPDLSIAGFVEKINQDLSLELNSIHNDINFFLEKEPKPHHDKYTQNFYKHKKPQVQNKSFKPPIRKTQRKK